MEMEGNRSVANEVPSSFIAGASSRPPRFFVVVLTAHLDNLLLQKSDRHLNWTSLVLLQLSIARGIASCSHWS